MNKEVAVRVPFLSKGARLCDPVGQLFFLYLRTVDDVKDVGGDRELSPRRYHTENSHTFRAVCTPIGSSVPAYRILHKC